MPNHVHVLFQVDVTPMTEILESWKKHTAGKANRLLNRRGKFWQSDYWDTFMRDRTHERTSCRYIETNPSKAGLVVEPGQWAWSSARFRDDFGALQF
jgi:REP element-mobilizing transposase RayT